jgi:hypothetical protein
MTMSSTCLSKPSVLSISIAFSLLSHHTCIRLQNKICLKLSKFGWAYSYSQTREELEEFELSRELTDFKK